MAYRVSPLGTLHVCFEILNKAVEGHGGVMKRRVLEDIADLTRAVWREEMSQIRTRERDQSKPF